MNNTSEHGSEKKDFNFQGFFTLTLTLAFIILVVTGIILYLTPKGRVANWVNWTMLGLDKEEWGAVHITSAILVLIASGFHLYFNWRVFVRYFKSNIKKGLNLKRELVVAVILGIVFVGGTVSNIPPFSTIMYLNEEIKDYWESRSPSAPIAHAEELTLEEFAGRINLTTDEIIVSLRQGGFTVPEGNPQIGDIAEANNIAPSDIYAVIKPVKSDEPAMNGSQSGSTVNYERKGLGRLSLKQYCEEEGLNFDSAMEYLASQGVFPEPDSTMKQMADSLNLFPADVAEKLHLDQKK